MKKLLIVLLTVALTLSLVAVASAATVNTYMGGRFYITYRSNYDNPGNLIELNNASAQAPGGGVWNNRTMITMNWNVKAESGNSFAKLQWLNEVWGAPSTENFTYSFGQTNLGDMFDWQINTGNVSSTLIGQAGINVIDSLGQYDPMYFNRPKGILAIGVHTDAIKLNVEYQLKEINGTADGKACWTTAFTYKMDSGDIHAGIAGPSDQDGGAKKGSMIVGTKIKLEGLGTLVADYYTCNWGGPDNGTFQAGLDFDELKMGVVLGYYMPNGADSAIGLKYTYTGIEKITLGVKYFTNGATALGLPTSDAAYELSGDYNLGAFSVRLAYEKPGAGDAYFVLGAFGSIW